MGAAVGWRWEKEKGERGKGKGDGDPRDAHRALPSPFPFPLSPFASTYLPISMTKLSIAASTVLVDWVWWFAWIENVSHFPPGRSI